MTSLTFWITGASSGIGEALALEAASQGHRIILSARSRDKLVALKERCPDPSKVAIVCFDLKATSEAKRVTEEAWTAFHGIDVVVLNGGISQRSLAEESQLEAYRELMEVNYFGSIALGQMLLPYFLQQGHGHFVAISSLVGKFGTPYRSGYSASKHALHGYFDSLRAEMMMKNRAIDVTIICPGFVSTNISFNALGPGGKALGQYDQANAQGLTPSEFSRRALAAVARKEFEAYIGGKETWGVYLKRFFPTLFARKIAQAKVR